MAKVVIAGGTGFVGQYLQKRFEEENFEVLIVSRQINHVSWQNEEMLTEALEGAEMLINLAGKPINTNFSEENKIHLIYSRVSTTETLGKALSKCTLPPKVWFNASGAHIYGTSDEKAHIESDPFDQQFFPAIMAQKWEESFEQFKLPHTRKIALRIAIVLGKDGGVLQPFLMLGKLLMGGKQGSGQQKFSWIHLEDFYQILHFAFLNDNLSGPINICSPEVVNNTELMANIRKVLGVPFGFPAPKWGIKIGAGLMGIESDLILKSLSVYPEKLLKAGYTFRYPTLNAALKEIVK